MAYLAFDFDTGCRAIDASRDLATRAEFTQQEWLVIRLARDDSPASLRPATRLDRLMSLLFGTRAANPLADSRLEALRRAAVHLWKSDHMNAVAHLEAMRTAGFSSCHIGALAGYIGTYQH